MIVLEIVADDVPARHRDAAQPALAVGMLGEPLVDRLAPPDRRVGDGVEDRLDGVVFGDHAPVGGGVLFRELGELLAGAVDVVPLRQIGCRPGKGNARRFRDECIRGRSRRARARRCAASGCPGSRHARCRTNRAGSRAASVPRSRNCRRPPAGLPAPGSGSRPSQDRPPRSGCCARRRPRRHRNDQASAFHVVNRHGRATAAKSFAAVRPCISFSVP